MSIPKYDEMYNDFLDIIKDGREYNIKEIKEIEAKKLKLTEEELNEQLSSGKNTRFSNRIGWTSTYLKKAGLISSPQRGVFVITDEGKKSLNKNINNDFLMQYKTFKEFKKRENNENSMKVVQKELTPQERIEYSMNEINEELADSLLNEIKKQPFTFLENLAVKLMCKMGYGNRENATTTKPTNDGGIDGIVFEDELGINKILIQTKRYGQETTVGSPDIQRFKGAMEDYGAKEGVFITTSKFSDGAIKSAKKSNVILIDGDKLTKLMIKYNVGCFTDNSYEVKKLDLDFFEND